MTHRARGGCTLPARFNSRYYQCWMSTRATLACFLALAWLPQLGRADTFHIGVNLFTDLNCLFKADNFIATDGGCYANKYAPNMTLGFSMTIVGFNDPAKIDFYEYSDDCHTLSKPKRTLQGGVDRCNLFLGSLYAQFNLRFRSNTCQGESCSTLAITIQTFYNGAGCSGPEYAVFRYPVQGECLRATNGTQEITTSGDDSNITLNDYIGSDNCEPPWTRNRLYSIVNQYCYPLYVNRAPRSFVWRVERSMPYKPTASLSSRPSGTILFPLALAAGLSNAASALDSTGLGCPRGSIVDGDGAAGGDAWRDGI